MPKKGKGRGRGRGRGSGQVPDDSDGKNIGRGRSGPQPTDPVVVPPSQPIASRDRDAIDLEKNEKQINSKLSSNAAANSGPLQQPNDPERNASKSIPKNSNQDETLSDRFSEHKLDRGIPPSKSSGNTETVRPPTLPSNGGARPKEERQPPNRAPEKLGSTTQNIALPQKNGAYQPIARKSFGTLGRPIPLRANLLRMKIPTYGDIYHYDVTFQPESRPAANYELIKKLTEEYGKVFSKPVFDGKKNMYTKERLPIKDNGQEFLVKLILESSQKEKEFKVTIKFASRVSIELLNNSLRGDEEIPRDTIQAYEVVLRMTSTARYIPIGRSFFSKPDRPFDLGEGAELWYGTFKSVRPKQEGMMINIDLAATAFYKTQDVVEFLKEILKLDSVPPKLVDSHRVQFNKSIKGLKVQLGHIVGQKRQKRILGVARDSARDIKFEMEENGNKQTISVANYFLKKYNIQLQYPDLPCLKAGSDANPIHLPMEVCTLVPGQRHAKKLSEGQTSRMIRETAKDAATRKRIIEQKIREANFAGDEYLNHFSMKVNQELVSVKGRVLDAPQIHFNNKDRQLKPREGKWDLRDKSFFEGVRIKQWGLLVCSSQRFFPEENANQFCSELSKQSKNLGMPMEQYPIGMEYHNRRQTLEATFHRFIEKVPKLQILVVILDGPLYAEIKAIGDTRFGIPTQCVKVKNAKRPSPQLMSNICLKINAKVGGTNSYFDNDQRATIFRNPKIFGSPVIFLGADVTHPAPSETHRPSIAAVVGSLDENATKFAARVKVQGHRKEIIEDMKGMTMDLLKTFYRKLGLKPNRIIMYRDGVSEGQFPLVLQFEVSAVQQACRSLQADYKPLITFMTVQKRHHVRLFPEEKKDEVGKGRNIPAGTVVDTTICHPSEFDFYLCSHSGIQGTSRPAHYRVLWDDSGFSADELQQLTYSLCHNYARCTRAVSIPPPAYYAHHVAMRARYHLAAHEGSSQGSSSGESAPQDMDNMNRTLAEVVKTHANLESSMYFI